MRFESLEPRCLLAAVTPAVDSWLLNTTGAKGTSPDPAIDAIVSQFDVDVQQIRHNATDVYINATGIPSYSIGPWPDGNPDIAMNQNYLVQIPKVPVEDTMGPKTATPLGRIGHWVNGIAIYNPLDGKCHMNDCGTYPNWQKDATVFELDGQDAANGHPSAVGGGQYHHHFDPTGVRAQLGDDGTSHSPILGFAYDGFPVYGPFGFDNPDGTGVIRRMESSYQLKTGMRPISPNDPGGPFNGDFVQDYEYVDGLGDLDEHNLRMAVTPEYPGGTYAYYVTLKSDLTTMYPHLIGPEYFGLVIPENLSQTVTVPGDVVPFPQAQTVDTGPDATIAEGDSFVSAGSFADPDGDTWTATVDYGEGLGPESLVLNPDKTFALSNDYEEDGVYTVSVAVTDDDGAVGSDTAVVTVNNEAPVVDAGSDGAIDEGDTFTGSGSFTDPGADTWTATVNYGDGGPAQSLPLNLDKTFNLSHQYVSDGVFTVTVVVTDDEGGSGSDTRTVNVATAALIVDAGPDQTKNEGQMVNFDGSFINPNPPSTHTLQWDFGDGNSTSGTLTPTHVYAADDTYTARLTVTDADGDSGTDTLTVTVNNVAPTADFTNDGPVDEGGSANVSFSNQFDPSSADTTAGFRYAYDFGNDGNFEIGDGTYGGSVTADSAAVPSALLAVGPATVDVKGLIIDQDGEFTDYVTSIEVNGPDTDLSLDKSDDGSDAVAGENYTYTLKVTNNGPSDSTGGTVSDTLPTGWTFVSGTGCTGTASGFDCTVGALGVGDMQTFTVLVAVPDNHLASTVTNNATVTADETDPVAGNNSGTEDTTVRTAIGLAAAAIFEAQDIVEDLGPGKVTNPSDQRSFLKFLDDALADIDAGRTVRELHKRAANNLEKAIARTDGCLLHPPLDRPDGEGQGQDWITDCAVQEEVLDLLSEGLHALQNIGDVNFDGSFDQLDIELVLAADKFLRNSPATWSEGDWNRDGLFDMDDIVSALQDGSYSVR